MPITNKSIPIPPNNDALMVLLRSIVSVSRPHTITKPTAICSAGANPILET